MGKKKKAKMRASTPVFTWVDDEWVQLSPGPPFVASDDGMTPVHIVGNGGRLDPPFVASETSYEAAQKIEPSTAILRERIFRTIEAAGFDGMTDEEIALFTKINPSTARPRRVELVKAGHVAHIGYGTTTSGCKAKLWGAVDT